MVGEFYFFFYRKWHGKCDFFSIFLFKNRYEKSPFPFLVKKQYTI